MNAATILNHLSNGAELVYVDGWFNASVTMTLDNSEPVFIVYRRYAPDGKVRVTAYDNGLNALFHARSIAELHKWKLVERPLPPFGENA